MAERVSAVFSSENCSARRLGSSNSASNHAVPSGFLLTHASRPASPNSSARNDWPKRTGMASAVAPSSTKYSPVSRSLPWAWVSKRNADFTDQADLRCARRSVGIAGGALAGIGIECFVRRFYNSSISSSESPVDFFIISLSTPLLLSSLAISFAFFFSAAVIFPRSSCSAIEALS